MTRSFCFVLALSLVGCGGSAATSACAALATCCDSGLPDGVGSTCGALAKSTDESACSQALSEIQAASYCASVEKGPTETSSHPCDQYLSCLLATDPGDYAAALPLYGSGSACWANSAQTAGCNQACDAAFAEIATSCTCTGDSCTSCSAPTIGTYVAEGEPSGTCGAVLWLSTVQVVSIAADRTASIIVDVAEESVDVAEESLTFTGTLACSGPSTFTASGTSDDTCAADLTLTFTPAGTPDAFIVTVNATLIDECSQTGEPTSCSESVTVEL